MARTGTSRVFGRSKSTFGRKGDAAPGTFKGYFDRRDDARDLSFDVTGEEQFIERLNRISQVIAEFISGGGDTYDIEKRLENRQVRRWMKNYNSEGAEYGQKWAKYVKPKSTWDTQYRLNPRYNIGSTLNRTGTQKGQHSSQMRESASSYSIAVGEGLGVSWKFSNDIASGYYAVSHHTGYTFGKKNSEVPARQIWDLDQKDETNAYKLFSKWAHDKLRSM